MTTPKELIKHTDHVHCWLANVYDIYGDAMGDETETLSCELDDMYHQLEKQYKLERPEVFAKIQELIKENEEFKKECQSRREKEVEEDLKIKEARLEYLSGIWGSVEEKRRLIKEVETISKRLSSGITDEMIDKAKLYPIEKLIEVNKGFALCPFHDDKNPSFYVKNGYGYCFSCNKNASPIDICMEVKGYSFKDAVKFLN